jgi:outer membrane protein, heavy metal efflux system
MGLRVGGVVLHFLILLMIPQAAVCLEFGELREPALLPGGGRSSVVPTVEIPTKLSFEEALRIFRSNGLDLLIAEAAVDSARADRRIASAIANPAVSVSRGKSSGFDPSLCAGCSDVLWTAGVSDQGALADSLVGKRRLRIEVADAALSAARLSRADAERTLVFLLKQQYVTASLGKASLDFARQTSEAAAQTLHLVRIRYEAGAVSEADVARANTVKLEADQGADQADQSARQERATLAFLLGVRRQAPDFEVEDEFLEASVPAELSTSTEDDLLEAALDQRPDLRAAEAQKSRAASSVALARRERFPDLDLSLEYSKEGTGQSALQPPTTSVGLSLTVPVFYRSQGAIAKAEADLTTQELQTARTQAQVVADVKSALAAFTGARRRAERMESSLLDQAQRARDLVRIQYERGAASLLELIDAQRTLTATHIEHIQNLVDFWTAVFQVEEAVGREFRR